MVNRVLKNRLNGFFHMMNLAVERKEKDEIIADFANWINSNYIPAINNDEGSIDKYKKSLDRFVEITELNDLVDMVVAKEYKRAVEKHGDKYNSYHEAMEVLRKALNGVRDEYNWLRIMYMDFWDWVQEDDFEGVDESVDYYKEAADKAIIAMVQVRVALEKMGNMKEGSKVQDEKDNR